MLRFGFSVCFCVLLSHDQFVYSVFLMFCLLRVVSRPTSASDCLERRLQNDLL